MKTKSVLLTAVTLLALSVGAHASLYSGNGNNDWGGAVGSGSLSVTDDGANITFSFTRGPATLDNVLVLYLDTVAGGFSDTSPFNDDGDGARSAISGYTSMGNSGSSGRSLMTFEPAFQPDYAVTFEGVFASLFQLQAGDAYSHNWIGGTSQGGDDAPSFSVTVMLSDLGLTPGESFTLFGTYISTTGFRSAEAIAGDESGWDGWNSVSQTGLATYTTVPEPSATALIALAGFAGWIRRSARCIHHAVPGIR